MQKQNINERSIQLLGEENINKLTTKKVAVIGLGGVGSIIPIVLSMSNIKNFLLIDFDKVSYSNLNRQIAYDLNDVDLFKADALKNKLNSLRDDLNITSINTKISEEFDFSILNDCDYVIDCIDDIPSKVKLIKYCFNNGIKIVSSLGMGNRLDPSQIIITTLNKTTSDPLAKKLRYLLKKEEIDTSKIMTVFSKEEVIIKDRIVSSMAFVPNAAGLNLASFVMKELIK